MKRIYKITVKDSATYVIEAESREMAEEKAIDWFHEREPDITIKIENIKKYREGNIWNVWGCLPDIEIEREEPEWKTN